MIAITVTQQIKDRNQLSTAVGSIYTQSNYPNVWWGSERVVGGYRNRTDLHKADGWRDVSRPPIGANQRRGPIFFDEANNVFTYKVIDLTDEEITARIASQYEAEKDQKVQARLQAQVVQELQSTTDDAKALENIDVFPFWEAGIDVTAPDKYKFIHKLELKLYRVEQDHTTQAKWTPPEVPALFTRVAAPGQILPWSQPSGAQDAYEMGAKVTHNGSCWENTGSPANVWEPGVFGWTEIPCE